MGSAAEVKTVTPLEHMTGTQLIAHAEDLLGMSGPELAAVLAVAYNGGYTAWRNGTRTLPLYVKVSLILLLYLKEGAPKLYAQHMKRAPWLK